MTLAEPGDDHEHPQQSHDGDPADDPEQLVGVDGGEDHGAPATGRERK